MATKIKGTTEVNYPDVVGWEWRGEPFGENPEGLLHQLVWDRHNGGFMYSTKNPAGRWVNVSCRGAMWEGADTLAKAREVARGFIEGDD
jgi:hypothetical protein